MQQPGNEQFQQMCMQQMQEYVTKQVGLSHSYGDIFCFSGYTESSFLSFFSSRYVV